MKIINKRGRTGRGRYTSEGFISDPDPVALPVRDQMLAFAATIGFIVAFIITVAVVLGGS